MDRLTNMLNASSTYVSGYIQFKLLLLLSSRKLKLTELGNIYLTPISYVKQTRWHSVTYVTIIYATPSLSMIEIKLYR